MVSQEEIDRFMDRVPDHVVVVFDEAYYEFVENPPDTLKFIREGRENVVVLRTFSKIQGLAGSADRVRARRESIISVLQKTRQPFNANAIAQAGAIAGLARSGAPAQDAGTDARGAGVLGGAIRARWAWNTSPARRISSS